MSKKINYLTKPIHTLIDEPRNIKLYLLNNVQLTGISLYYPNVLLQTKEELFIPYNEKSMSFNRKTIYEEEGMEYSVNINSTELLTIEKDPVYFFIYNVENYYHFIYDSLPYLYYYFELLKTVPKLKLLIQSHSNTTTNLFPFVKETLELLNITNICFASSETLYNSIYISSSLTHEDKSNEPPNKQIRSVYNRLIQNVLSQTKNKNINSPLKMYISRRTYLHNKVDNIGTNYTQRRVLKEETDIVEYLKQFGFEEVFPECWTMKEKIYNFLKATHIVGLIGGGMCNLLFSPQTTKSYVIISPYFLDINYRFKYSMEHTQINYFKDTEIEYINHFNYSKYQRVKILDGKHKNKYGEIEDIDSETNKIKILIGSETSVSVLSTSNIIVEDLNNIITIDNGLNSPFHLNITNLKDWFYLVYN